MLLIVLFAIIGAFRGITAAESMFTAWYFLPLWVLTILTAVIAIIKVRKRPGLIMIHLGIIIIIIGALWAAPEASALRDKVGLADRPMQGMIWLQEGQQIDHIPGAHGSRAYPLEFTLQLDDFTIEYYPQPPRPKGHGILNIETPDNQHTVPVLNTGPLDIPGNVITISIKEIFTSFSVIRLENGTSAYVNTPNGSPNPAVLADLIIPEGRFSVLVFDRFDSMLINENPGHSSSLPEGYRLNYTLPGASHPPQVKDYISTIRIIQDGMISDPIRIEVNTPLHWGGYYFYQSSFQDLPVLQTGLQVVSDRGWLWMIMPGLILLLAGSFVYAAGKNEIRPLQPVPLKSISREKRNRGLLITAITIWAGIILTLILHHNLTLLRWLTASAFFPLAILPWLISKQRIKLIYSLISITSVILIGVWILRWIQTGHAPLQNMYEVMLGLNALYLLLILLMDRFLGIKLAWYDPLINAFMLVPAAFVFNPAPRLLPPALQSPYFIPHVAAYLIAYLLLTRAGILAAAGLNKTQKESYNLQAMITVKLGFPFLTTGLLLGCLWAHAAWGDWWGWDPKELWSLVSWLLFAIVLHIPMQERFARLRSWFIITGLAAIIITLTWVNLSRIFEGMHSYA